MATPTLHEMKRQTSFFIKEKIKNARLALTDVTPVQLLLDEATNKDSPIPDARTMRLISRAAFEVDDFWRIVDILHKRLHKFDKKNWRASFNSLTILEHLLTHGPLSSADEFQSYKEVIRDMANVQYIDEKGFNWGLIFGKKTQRVGKMLDDKSFLQEERNRARKITREIKGFGSFNKRDTSTREKEEPVDNMALLGKASEDGDDNDHPFFQRANTTRTSLLSSSHTMIFASNHSFKRFE